VLEKLLSQRSLRWNFPDKTRINSTTKDFHVLGLATHAHTCESSSLSRRIYLNEIFPFRFMRRCSRLGSINRLVEGEKCSIVETWTDAMAFSLPPLPTQSALEQKKLPLCEEASRGALCLVTFETRVSSLGSCFAFFLSFRHSRS
jgi:hypothetical protein